MAARLTIVPIGPLPPGAPAGLRDRLAGHGFDPVVEPSAGPRVAALLGPGQGRLDAHFAVNALRADTEGRVLGLTAAELKHDTRPFVYGLAEVNGRAAVFTTHPFFQGGLAPEESLDGLAGAVLHELAHTLGMVHCRQRGCLMSATHEPAVMRRLKPRFCATCGPLWAARVARLR